jgi:hypothetical protein
LINRVAALDKLDAEVEARCQHCPKPRCRGDGKTFYRQAGWDHGRLRSGRRNHGPAT